MKKNVLSLFILLLTVLISSISYAVTYDMNSLSTGYYTESSFNNVFSGVSFNNTGGDGFYIFQVNDLKADFSGNAVMNIPYTNIGNSTIATFSEAVFSVSVTMGDYNSDSDSLYLFAYDGGGTQIDSAFFANPASSIKGRTLGVSSSLTDIAYVEFYGVGLGQNSVLWDNFSFNEDISSYNQAVVPEPATIILLGAGLIGAAGVRERKRTK